MNELRFWQKLALIGVALAAVAHFIRDNLQNFGVNNFFTEFLHKDVGSDWQSLLIEAVLIVLVIVSFKQKKFVPAGLAACIILLLSLLLWFFIYVFW